MNFRSEDFIKTVIKTPVSLWRKYIKERGNILIYTPRFKFHNTIKKLVL